jgi:hypothetical protein
MYCAAPLVFDEPSSARQTQVGVDWSRESTLMHPARKYGPDEVFPRGSDVE